MIALVTRVAMSRRSSASCKRDGVDDRGQHAHVIAGHAVDALGGRGHAAEDVAAADDDGDLDAHLLHFAELVGDRGQDVGVDAGAPPAHEGLTGKFEKDALELGGAVGHARRFIPMQRLRGASADKKAARSGPPPGCRRPSATDFMYDATSAAKSSERFSMPSPSL